MDCEVCREAMVQVVEGLAEPAIADAVADHLAACSACRADAAAIAQVRARLVRAADAPASGGVVETVTGRIRTAAVLKSAGPGKLRWTMRRGFQWGSGVAAAVALVVVLLVWGRGQPQARAEQVLREGAKAMAEVQNLYIRAQVRTLPQDNFELIGPEYDFVTVDFWKQVQGQELRWRIEKQGRVMAMDGQTTRILMDPGLALKYSGNAPAVGPFRALLDLAGVVEHETKLAQAQGSKLTVTTEKRGQREVSVVTVAAKAKGDFTHDWMRNKSITEADNRRVYCFDAQTKRLEGLEIWVRANDKDILVFQTTQVEYPEEVKADRFQITLPSGVVWQEPAKLEAGGEVPAAVAGTRKADEVTQAFFDALAQGDAVGVGDFFTIKQAQLEKALQTGALRVKVIRIGQPFQSGQYPGWFVPYEVEWIEGKHTQNKKGNLAVRNDNPAKRWIVDGGI